MANNTETAAGLDPADVTIYRSDSIGYGTPHELALLLDSMGQSIREEPDEQWRDEEVRSSTASLRDLLNARLSA